MTVFRQAQISDLEAVCQLYRTALENAFSVWNEEYPSRVDAEHDLKTGNLFVLSVDDSIAGTLSIVPESEMEHFDIWLYPRQTHREIARIAISPKFQGRGFGAMMVKAGLNVLRERGYKSVRLSAACCNLPACRLYRKLGFEIRGEADLYGNHYYLMEKKL